MLSFTELSLPASFTPEPVQLFVSRLLLVLGMSGLIGFVCVKRGELAIRLRTFVLTPAGPGSLGGLRFVVFGSLFVLAVTRHDLMLTSPFRPAHALHAPYPMIFELPQWCAFPIPPMPLCTLITVDFRIVCLLAAVGAATRFTCVIAAALAFYIFGVCQSFGALTHVHHLVTLALLLSLSPCGDALSVDAWVRRCRGLPAPPSPRLCYGAPMRLAVLLLACLMFSPGFWKLWISGIQWATADNLRNILHAEWSIHGVSPFRVDRYPWLCAAAVNGILALELSLPMVVFGSARIRAAAGIAAFLFVASVNLIMGIPFWHLAVCFVAFIEWERLQRASMGNASEEAVATVPEPLPRAVLVVGTWMVTGFALCGALRVAIWPFVDYCSFERLYPPVRYRVRVSLRHLDGGTQPLPSTAIVYPLWWHLAECLPKLPVDLRTARAAEMAPWLRSRGVAIAPTDALEFYQETVWTDPDRAAEPPLSRTLLLSRPAGP